MKSKTKKPSSMEIENCQIIQERITKANGDYAVKNYSKGNLLGKGGFASVYEFTCLENKEISAGKIINKNCLTKARARQKLMFEIKIHRSLHHTNIVRFDRFFEDADNIYILLEICQNQTLNELMRRRKRLTEIEVQCYLVQLVSALKYLHAHRVIHRDIKLGNIFLTDKMEVKLGDFGLATKLEFDGERKRTICGTPNYIAPEIIEGKQGHSYEVDLWSLGVLVYSLSVGKPPFETNDIKLTYRKIKMNAYNFPESVNLSDEIKDLISCLLVNDPEARLTLDQVLDHPFLTKCTVPKLMPASTLAVPPSLSFCKQFQVPQRIVPRGLTKSETSIKLSRDESSDKSQEINANDDLKSKSQRSSISTSSSSKKIASVSAHHFVPGSAKTWIKKWVDYSDKYGIGYILSNGSIGVCFNDTTKCVVESNEICYISYKRGEEEIVKFSLHNFPSDLKKKVTLVEHFRKYLEIDKPIDNKENELVYLKKWMVTEHAIIFRLSNRVVQVRFLDRSELILCSASKTVVYIDHKGNTQLVPLKDAIESPNKELLKRMNYTTEMLSRMAMPQTARN